MGKVVSYRQKLIELARIYKIDKVFDQNVKHTTYDIELILLRNKVPLPSRRGYIAHKLINEVWQPLTYKIKKKLSIDININKLLSNININKYLKNAYEGLIKKLAIKFSLDKYLSKILKKIFNVIENYFKFVISSIINFFKILFKTIIETLNDVYNFKVNEKIIKNLLLKGVFASLVVALVYSGFYIKGLITDVDSLKISVEIKSDKKKVDSKKKKEIIVKTPDNEKKNNSKNLAKLPTNKEPSISNNDYSLNTKTVLNLFKDLEYDLDKVRNKKKVKPIYFTRLPKDLDAMKNIKEKKETFL